MIINKLTLKSLQSHHNTSRWKRELKMNLYNEISFNIEKALANKNTFIEFHIRHKDFFGSLSVQLTHRLMLFSRNAPKDFGLSIFLIIRNRPKKGKFLLKQIEDFELLGDFHKFDNEHSTSFIKDFKTDKNLIFNDLQKILNKLFVINEVNIEYREYIKENWLTIS